MPLDWFANLLRMIALDQLPLGRYTPFPRSLVSSTVQSELHVARHGEGFETSSMNTSHEYFHHQE